MPRKTTALDLLNGKTIFKEDFKIYRGLDHKKVLVTGAMGTIGHALFHKLFFHGINVTGIDNNESAIADYMIRDGHTSMKMLLMDVADLDRFDFDVVFHCAAYKHIVLGEMPDNKNAYMFNNVDKTYGLLARFAARSPKNYRFVLASTDKVTKSSTMGRTKAIAEKIVSDFGHTSVRLVNVIGSRGSVIDMWDRSSEPKLADPLVTRYWMQSTDAAYCMVLAAISPAGVYVPHSPPRITLGQMAKAWESLQKGKVMWKEYKMGESEAMKETLTCENEKLLPQNNILDRVVRC